MNWHGPKWCEWASLDGRGENADLLDGTSFRVHYSGQLVWVVEFLRKGRSHHAAIIDLGRAPRRHGIFSVRDAAVLAWFRIGERLGAVKNGPPRLTLSRR